MLIVYLVALALGGTVVAASILFGGDTESDVGVDVDVDADVDTDLVGDGVGELEADAGADADSDTGVSTMDGFLAWLPVTSLRFWTFFLAFFGLTGTVLTAFGLLSSTAVTAAISVGIGYLAGTGMIAALRYLSRNQIGSTVSEHDYVGANGTVMLPVARAQLGTIRIEMKGRTVELLARTDDDRPLDAGDPVMVYSTANDHVLVTRAG
ncbi:MAG: DUF1449 family protein [Proteobacteria bacterium]|nr:DUF1449 family protein [Pseudomonadota bacterium]